MWQKIVLLGAGGVAESFLDNLVKAGNPPIAVYNRTPEKAERLVARYSPSTEVVYALASLPTDADLYIFALSDRAIEDVAHNMPHTDGVWLHTAAVVPLAKLSLYHPSSGVFYLFNTFSPGIVIPFSHTPLFVEASNKMANNAINQLSSTLRISPVESTIELRRRLHLSGVLVCNFVNHLFTLTQRYLQEIGVSFSVVQPIIGTTCMKAMSANPEDAQTGPAKRGDMETIEQHRILLQETAPSLLPIYDLLSESIASTHRRR